jgi:hypothetical protein
MEGWTSWSAHPLRIVGVFRFLFLSLPFGGMEDDGTSKIGRKFERGFLAEERWVEGLTDREMDEPETEGKQRDVQTGKTNRERYRQSRQRERSTDGKDKQRLVQTEKTNREKDRRK